MSINRNTTSAIEVVASNTWTLSNIYKDTDFANWKVLPNQSSYTIEFQFALQGSSGTSYMKDINIVLDVMDDLPALSP